MMNLSSFTVAFCIAAFPDTATGFVVGSSSRVQTSLKMQQEDFVIPEMLQAKAKEARSMDLLSSVALADAENADYFSYQPRTNVWSMSSLSLSKDVETVFGVAPVVADAMMAKEHSMELLSKLALSDDSEDEDELDELTVLQHHEERLKEIMEAQTYYEKAHQKTPTTVYLSWRERWSSFCYCLQCRHTTRRSRNTMNRGFWWIHIVASIQ